MLAEFKRPREIVALASKMTKAKYLSRWLFMDEEGTWERMATEFLEKTAENAKLLGMSEEKVNEEIASHLVFLGATAILRKKKSSSS